MINKKYTSLLFDQTRDLIWMVDDTFNLVNANQAYLNQVKQDTGKEIKLHEPVLVEGFGERYIEKWTNYYKKALSGECFEVEEHYCNPQTNEIQYVQVIFNPIYDEDNQVVAVACQSRDITRIVKQRSEAHQLMDASLDVFCTVNEAGNFVFVSKAASKHWGYTPSELIGKPYVSFIIDEDIPKSNAIANDILHGKEIKSFVNRYKRKDGAIAYNLWSARWDDEAKLMYCVARDSKEKMEQETLLHQSEQRFKSLVQDGADMISIIDIDGKYSYTSPTTTGILGITPEEFQGRTIFDFIHPDDIERAAGYMKQINTESKVIVEPFRLRDGKNEWRWIETVLTNMLDNPAVNGIVANSRDITENVNMLNEIEANEQFNKTVIENSPDCLKIMDNEGRLLYMNFNGLCQMEIDDFSEVKNRKWWQLWGAENETLVKESVEKALTGETIQFTAFCPTAKGTPKWWDVTVSPVAKPGEPIQKIISVSRDVTDKKIKEQQKQLFTDISINFNREYDYVNACKGLCQTIAGFGGFDWVELWTVNIDGSKVQYTGHYLQEPANEVFYAETKDIHSFEKGNGLPGQVWQHKNQLLCNVLDDQKEFFRKKAAKGIGIKAILGIPLLNQDEVIGVLIVGSKQGIESLGNYTDLFTNFHNFIGSEIYRKKLENDLSRLYESIPDIVCVSDFQGRFLKINRSGCALLGYSEEELLNHGYEEFIFPADKDISTQELAKLSQGQSTFSFENRYVKKNGKLCWLSWTTNVDLKEGLIYATAKNISMEKKLRELNKVTSKMARIGSWEIDLAGNKLYWSDMVHELHETDPKTFIPEVATAINFYREDFRALVQKGMETSISTGNTFDFEGVIITANKKELWVRVISNAEFVNGQCVRIYGSFQDIHERKEADLRLLSLADNLPGVVFQFQLFPDGTSKFLNLSKGVEKLYGIDAELIINNNDLVWDQVVAGGDFDKLQASIAESQASLTNWHVIYRNKLPNGKIIWLEGWGTPRRLPDGSTIWDSIILEITDLKEAEQLLASASKLARVGSWEIVLGDNQEFKVFWSGMTKNILEIDESFEPTIANGIKFYKEPGRSLMEAAVNNAIETGEAFDLELELVTGKGNDIWIRCIGDAQFENGKVTRIYGSFQDINTRKLAELNHLKLNEEKSTILESIGDAFYALDGELNFTYMNSSCANLLAVKKEKIIGKNLFTEFPDLKNTLFHDELRKVQHTAEATKFEFYYAPFDAWFDERIYPTPNGVSVYFADITQRKKANAEIAKSEEKTRLIMNGALDAIITIDTTETITFWNSQAEVIFGWKAEEVMGKSLSEIIIPEPFRSYPIEGLKNYLKTGEGRALNVLVELSALKRNGEEFPIELTVIPIKQGSEEFFCAFIRDITQRKKSEKALLNAFTEKTRILERITEAFVSLDTNWCYTYMNKQAGEIFNKDPEKIVGKHIWTEFPEGLNQPFHHAYEKAMATQEYIYLEEHYKPYDSWFENHIYPSPDGISIFFRDVTERKRNEEKLKMANERFEKVTEATNDAIWDWNIADNTLYWGGGFKNTFGFDVDKTTPMLDSWTAHIHPEDIDRVTKSLEQAVTNKQDTFWTNEYRFQKNDGSYAIVIDRGVVIRDSKGTTIRMVGAMTDITQRKLQELQLITLNQSLNQQAEELKRSNEELEQFAFVASHDLQEPLRMITSFMDKLNKKYDTSLDERAKQYINFAIDGAIRMKQLILDLLVYSRANRPVEQLEQVKLNEIISEFLQLRRKLILEKKAVVQFGELPILESYKAPVTQIFHCLLDNALKYSKKNVPPIIDVKVIDKEDFLEFSIKDNGIGVDKIFFDKIFIIFQRLHNRNEYEGTGIGLSITKRCVEFLGGKIWLESEFGQGSIFYFTIKKLK